MTVGHLFFEYFDYLRMVHLRWLHGSMLKEHFEKWLTDYPDPYPQRYRRSVPYSFVKQHGILLMSLKDGEVVFPVLGNQIPIQTAVESESDED
jgi:hypothetical protein